MKSRFTAITAATLVLLCMAYPAPAQQKSPSPAQQSQLFYQNGIAAEKQWDAAAAKAAYEQALKLNPGNTNARYRLGMLKTNLNKFAAKGREASLGTIIIPEYKISEVEFSEALKALSLGIEKQTSQGVITNFIIQDPEGKISSKKITLALQQVPAATILKYLLEMSGGKARFDQHAIMIMPR